MVTFLTTVVIVSVNRRINRLGTVFFRQVIGGFIAVVPHCRHRRVSDRLGFQLTPSQVIAAGIVVLLSGCVGPCRTHHRRADHRRAAPDFRTAADDCGHHRRCRHRDPADGSRRGSPAHPLSLTPVRRGRPADPVADGSLAAAAYALACA